MEFRILLVALVMHTGSQESNGQGSYPFGFQGMERTDELRGDGNGYNTPFRHYDVRKGQWLTTDPVQKHHVSSYAGLANNPVRYFDPQGADDEEPEEIEFELRLPERGRVSVMGSEPWSYTLEPDPPLDLTLSPDDVTDEERDLFEEPRPIDLRVYGIGRSASPRLIRGREGSLVDITPYTGNHVADVFLSGLELLGVPILSYPQLSRYQSMSFRTVYAYSGGSPMVRNAFHYGFLQAERFELYGAPGTYNPDHYGHLPDISLHAHADDPITWIDLYYFNNPIAPGTSVPTFIQGIRIPFEGLIEGSRTGGHNYPEFNSLPERYRR